MIKTKFVQGLNLGLLLLVVTIGLLGGCKKDDKTTTTTTPPITTYTNSFSYKFNGVAQTVNSITAAKLVTLDTVLAIIGMSNSPNQSLLLTLDPNAAVGTFPLTFFGDYGIQHTNNTTLLSMGSVDGGGGNVVITKHDMSSKIIEGTFSSPIQDNLSPTVTGSITEGVFKVKY
jgi:hypothetical protein